MPKLGYWSALLRLTRNNTSPGIIYHTRADSILIKKITWDIASLIWSSCLHLKTVLYWHASSRLNVVSLFFASLTRGNSTFRLQGFLQQSVARPNASYSLLEYSEMQPWTNFEVLQRKPWYPIPWSYKWPVWVTDLLTLANMLYLFSRSYTDVQF